MTHNKIENTQNFLKRNVYCKVLSQKVNKLPITSQTYVTSSQNIMFTIQVLSQKVNKFPLTSIDLCYIVTKKNTASMKNPVK